MLKVYLLSTPECQDMPFVSPDIVLETINTDLRKAEKQKEPPVLNFSLSIKKMSIDEFLAQKFKTMKHQKKII
jgi:hypothetical protein